MSDDYKIMELLKKDSLADVIALLEDPCDGCEEDCTGRRSRTCGYYEQDGLQIGPAHARRELLRRQGIIKRALLTYDI